MQKNTIKANLRDHAKNKFILKKSNFTKVTSKQYKWGFKYSSNEDQKQEFAGKY